MTKGTNDGYNNLENNEDLKPLEGNIEISGSNAAGNDTVNVQGTEFTQEEIEAANKPQPNVILNATPDGNPNASGSYRDPERVNKRSNESPDSTDSNSGDMIAGAAKGVSQS